MESGRKLGTGKNALWRAYKTAKPLVRDEITLELKKADLIRYWRDTASKEGYDLVNAKGGLIQTFIKLMPETAPFFGLPAPRKVVSKQPAQDGTLNLFETH